MNTEKTMSTRDWLVDLLNRYGRRTISGRSYEGFMAFATPYIEARDKRLADAIPKAMTSEFPAQTKSVYLAGPITGLDEAHANAWRRDFAAMLPPGIVPIMPMRAEHLNALTTDKAVTSRSRDDVRQCDIAVFNFLGAAQVSVGSCVELGWADAFDKLSVLVMPKRKVPRNPHEHNMVRELCDFRVETLDEAAEVVVEVLGRGLGKGSR